MRAIVIGLLLVWTGLANAQPRVIALHPLVLPDGLSDPEPVRVQFDSLIATRLRDAGYQVVPPPVSGAMWHQLVQEVEGFYDPITGDTVASEYATVHFGTLRHLFEKHGATLWLRAEIEVVPVEWKRGKAKWDGVDEGVGAIGGGRVSALSLVVAVEDTSGTVLHEGRGGIQVLSKLKGPRYKDVPREKLFSQKKRNEEAVRLALEPLLSGGSP